MNAINTDIEVVGETNVLVSLLDTDLEAVGGGAGPADNTAPKTGAGGTG